VIGVDVGTASARAGLFDLYGNRLAIAVRSETIAIGGGLSAVTLIALNLYWIAYLWMRFTGSSDADWMLFYLIGGLADIGYVTAPLVWVLTMFWGVAAEDT